MMFQSFDVRTNPSQGIERVALLRAKLAEHKLDGFLVPRADEHQGEYVAACSERLQWLTGFTGSAGAALVLKDKAILFVDGRYTLQAKAQVDPGTFRIESLVENPPVKWLEANGEGLTIGFDPWLHTIAEVEAFEKAGIELTPVENLVDAVWADRPAPPAGKIEIHPHGFAGVLAKDKIADLSESLAKKGATHAVLTDPSSLAWVFNIRGSDVAHTPLALGFAILSTDELPKLFISRDKLTIETDAYLTQLADVLEPSQLEEELARIAALGGTVALDPVLAAEKLRMIVEENGGTTLALPDPARLPRATKNKAELAGSRAAHRRDGAAVTKYLCWLDRQEPGTIDEIQAVQALEQFRVAVGEETQMPLRDISFDTISGAGPNGAIIHYRVTTGTNRKLQAGELYLVDSGGQYQDGTTDITRTVAVGTPTRKMCERYTLVLKGLIQISLLRFPAGTRGMDIDAIARRALWAHGLDYAHGTGHGVGSFLSVHEGPQRIAKTGAERLLPGMIISNEPGYYKEGAYGIRLENLIVVEEAAPIPGGDIPMHSFETLTLAPFDRRLIVADMLDPAERAWLDAYHARVLQEIGPMLDGETLAWLEKAAAPL
ncbi:MULTISPECIES: aminopeptidase P family protein [unclassified Aminobacter]|uniref:aminopeptidase P family protein n=1 Tax=unclassified Aminobacter TaxID=2644704 RepID=UPI0004647C0C|nr:MULTISPECIES: aminopeptidase P family protein [unclassified Aminobacter]